MDAQASDISLSKPGGLAGPTSAVESARALSTEKFAELYLSAYRTLWCIASAVTGNRSKAGDVVQEASVVALSKLSEFDPNTNFTAWMAQIVRFVALNEGRRAQRERTNLDRLALQRETMTSVADVPSMDPRIEAALGKLDETARMCIVLRTVVEMGYAEISQALGIPEGTAMSHVFRARKVLRESLRGLEPSREDTGTGGGA